MPLMAGLAHAAAFAMYPTIHSSLHVRGVPQNVTFAAQGCFHEPPSHEGRALKAMGTATDSMTTQACAAFCANYQYFGTEYGRECFCGNTIAPNTLAAVEGCTMPCSGDASQICGAGDHLNIYINNAYVAPSIAAIEGYTYKGCRTEPAVGRALPDRVYGDDSLTPSTCASLCSADGFIYAGLEFGRECWCSNTLYGGEWVDDSECSMLCGGDKGSFCGAGGRLTVYGPETLTIAEVPNRSYIGCVVDDAGNRALSGRREVKEDMTAALCSSICTDYAYFGVEFGNECYCSNSFSPVVVDDAECDVPCRGDGTTFCGAPDRLTAYASTTFASNAETVGDYRFLHCGADSVGDRVLKGGYSHGDDMTIEKCAADCAGYSYFGLEFGKECFCGNEYSGVHKPLEDCYLKCSGDGTQLCGGNDRIAVYDSTPLPPSVRLCGRAGYCSYSTSGSQVAGPLSTELACRNAVAELAPARGYKAYYWTTASCYAFYNTIASTQCRFVEAPAMAGLHGELDCPPA